MSEGPTGTDGVATNAAQEKKDWKSPWGIIKNTIKNTFRPSTEVAKANIAQAIENEKTETSVWLNASKDVLSKYSKKALDAFKNFPNKTDFSQATLIGLIGTVYGGGMTAAFASGLFEPTLAGGTEPSVRIAGAAVFGAATLFIDSGSAAMFKAWYDKSFRNTKTTN